MSGGLASVGKTVPSYRMALEDEIGRWKTFRNTLSDEDEKQAPRSSKGYFKNKYVHYGAASYPQDIAQTIKSK